MEWKKEDDIEIVGQSQKGNYPVSSIGVGRDGTSVAAKYPQRTTGAKIVPCIGPTQPSCRKRLHQYVANVSSNASNDQKNTRASAKSLSRDCVAAKDGILGTMSYVTHILGKSGSSTSHPTFIQTCGTSTSPKHDIFPTLTDVELSVEECAQISLLTQTRLRRLRLIPVARRWSGPNYAHLHESMSRYTSHIRNWHATAQRDKVRRPTAISPTKEGTQNFLAWKKRRKEEFLKDHQVMEQSSVLSVEGHKLDQFSNIAEKPRIDECDKQVSSDKDVFSMHPELLSDLSPKLEPTKKAHSLDNQSHSKGGILVEPVWLSKTSQALGSVSVSSYSIPTSTFYGNRNKDLETHTDKEVDYDNLTISAIENDRKLVHKAQSLYMPTLASVTASDDSLSSYGYCLLCNKRVEKDKLERHMNACLDEQEDLAQCKIDDVPTAGKLCLLTRVFRMSISGSVLPKTLRYMYVCTWRRIKLLKSSQFCY